jgi:hypothetical protein
MQTDCRSRTVLWSRAADYTPFRAWSQLGKYRFQVKAPLQQLPPPSLLRQQSKQWPTFCIIAGSEHLPIDVSNKCTAEGLKCVMFWQRPYADQSAKHSVFSRRPLSQIGDLTTELHAQCGVQTPIRDCSWLQLESALKMKIDWFDHAHAML